MSVITTSSSPNATAYGFQRKIVRTTDVNKTLHVFIHNGTNIEWWRSIDNGVNWSLVVTRTGIFPCVVRDPNNNLHLVYTSPNRTTAYYCVQAYNASTFGTQRTLPALLSGYDVFGAPNINVTVINSTVYVFVIVNQYSVDGARHSAVFMCISNNGGVTWYKPDMVTTGWQSCSTDFTARHLSNIPSCYLSILSNLDLHAIMINADLGSSNTCRAMTYYVGTPFPHWEPTTWELVSGSGQYHDPDPASYVWETTDQIWMVGKRYGGTYSDLEEWYLLPYYGFKSTIEAVSRYPCVAVEVTHLNDAWCFYESNAVNANYDISYMVWDKSTDTWRTGVIRVTNDNLGNHYVNVKEREDNNRIEFIWTRGTSAPYDVMYGYISLVVIVAKSDYETYVLTEIGEVFVVPLPIDKLSEESYPLYEVSGKMEYPFIMPKVVIPVPIAIHSGMEITYRNSEAVSERKARFINIPTSRVPDGKNIRPVLKAIRPRYGFKVIRNGEVIYERWKEDDLLVWRGQMSLAYLLSQGNVGSTVGAFMLLISENATMPDMGDDSGDPEANEFNPLIDTPVTGTWTFEPTVKPSGQYPLSGWLYYEGDITADRNATLRKIGIIDTTPIPNRRIVCEDRVIEYAVLLNDVIRVRYWFPLG